MTRRCGGRVVVKKECKHFFEIPPLLCMKVTWYFNHQMFRKVLVCSFYRKFQLKILLFGKWRDEVVQMQSRRIRKATLCKTLTYLEKTESPLSPKVSLTTICDLCLLLRLPDRRGYFPLLCGSWLQFFCFSSFGTNYCVEDSSKYSSRFRQRGR